MKGILIAYGFPEDLMSLIMQCVTSVRFSIMMQGSMFGNFPGKRGLRQV